MELPNEIFLATTTSREADEFEAHAPKKQVNIYLFKRYLRRRNNATPKSVKLLKRLPSEAKARRKKLIKLRALRIHKNPMRKLLVNPKLNSKFRLCKKDCATGTMSVKKANTSKAKMSKPKAPGSGKTTSNKGSFSADLQGKEEPGGNKNVPPGKTRNMIMRRWKNCRGRYIHQTIELYKLGGVTLKQKSPLLSKIFGSNAKYSGKKTSVGKSMPDLTPSPNNNSKDDKVGQTISQNTVELRSSTDEQQISTNLSVIKSSSIEYNKTLPTIKLKQKHKNSNIYCIAKPQKISGEKTNHKRCKKLNEVATVNANSEVNTIRENNQIKNTAVSVGKHILPFTVPERRCSIAEPLRMPVSVPITTNKSTKWEANSLPKVINDSGYNLRVNPARIAKRRKTIHSLEAYEVLGAKTEDGISRKPDPNTTTGSGYPNTGAVAKISKRRHSTIQKDDSFSSERPVDPRIFRVATETLNKHNILTRNFITENTYKLANSPSIFTDFDANSDSPKLVINTDIEIKKIDFYKETLRNSPIQQPCPPVSVNNNVTLNPAQASSQEVSRPPNTFLGRISPTKPILTKAHDGAAAPSRNTISCNVQKQSIEIEENRTPRVREKVQPPAKKFLPNHDSPREIVAHRQKAPPIRSQEIAAPMQPSPPTRRTFIHKPKSSTQFHKKVRIVKQILSNQDNCRPVVSHKPLLYQQEPRAYGQNWNQECDESRAFREGNSQLLPIHNINHAPRTLIRQIEVPYPRSTVAQAQNTLPMRYNEFGGPQLEMRGPPPPYPQDMDMYPFFPPPHAYPPCYNNFRHGPSNAQIEQDYYITEQRRLSGIRETRMEVDYLYNKNTNNVLDNTGYREPQPLSNSGVNGVNQKISRRHSIHDSRCQQKGRVDSGSTKKPLESFYDLTTSEDESGSINITIHKVAEESSQAVSGNTSKSHYPQLLQSLKNNEVSVTLLDENNAHCLKTNGVPEVQPKESENDTVTSPTCKKKFEYMHDKLKGLNTDVLPTKIQTNNLERTATLPASENHSGIFNWLIDDNSKRKPRESIKGNQVEVPSRQSPIWPSEPQEAQDLRVLSQKTFSDPTYCRRPPAEHTLGKKAILPLRETKPIEQNAQIYTNKEAQAIFSTVPYNILNLASTSTSQQANSLGREVKDYKTRNGTSQQDCVITTDYYKAPQMSQIAPPYALNSLRRIHEKVSNVQELGVTYYPKTHVNETQTYASENLKSLLQKDKSVPVVPNVSVKQTVAEKAKAHSITRLLDKHDSEEAVVSKTAHTSYRSPGTNINGKANTKQHKREKVCYCQSCLPNNVAAMTLLHSLKYHKICETSPAEPHQYRINATKPHKQQEHNYPPQDQAGQNICPDEEKRATYEYVSPSMQDVPATRQSPILSNYSVHPSTAREPRAKTQPSETIVRPPPPNWPMGELNHHEASKYIVHMTGGRPTDAVGIVDQRIQSHAKAPAGVPQATKPYDEIHHRKKPHPSHMGTKSQEHAVSNPQILCMPKVLDSPVLVAHTPHHHHTEKYFLQTPLKRDTAPEVITDKNNTNVMHSSTNNSPKTDPSTYPVDHFHSKSKDVPVHLEKLKAMLQSHQPMNHHEVQIPSVSKAPEHERKETYNTPSHHRHPPYQLLINKSHKVPPHLQNTQNLKHNPPKHKLNKQQPKDFPRKRTHSSAKAKPIEHIAHKNQDETNLHRNAGPAENRNVTTVGTQTLKKQLRFSTSPDRTYCYSPYQNEEDSSSKEANTSDTYGEVERTNESQNLNIQGKSYQNLHDDEEQHANRDTKTVSQDVPIVQNIREEAPVQKGKGQDLKKNLKSTNNAPASVNSDGIDSPPLQKLPETFPNRPVVERSSPRTPEVSDIEPKHSQINAHTPGSYKGVDKTSYQAAASLVASQQHPHKETLTAEEYVQEIKWLTKRNYPSEFVNFYTFITRRQITNNQEPISFSVFLEFHNAGQLKLMEKCYKVYLHKHEHDKSKDK